LFFCLGIASIISKSIPSLPMDLALALVLGGFAFFWFTFRPLLEIVAMRRSLSAKGYPRYSLAMCLAIRALWAHRVAVTKAAPELPPRDELESLPGCSCESPLELIRYLLEFDRNLLVENDRRN